MVLPISNAAMWPVELDAMRSTDNWVVLKYRFGNMVGGIQIFFFFCKEEPGSSVVLGIGSRQAVSKDHGENSSILWGIIELQNRPKERFSGLGELMWRN